MAHQAGYGNTVAVSGTALSDHHVMLLQRLSNRVVLALDADRAGIAAVKRAAELMLARGMDVKVAKVNDGEDPADMIQKDVASFKAVVGKATHVIEFLLDVLHGEGHDERTYKLKVREEVLPYVVRIPNRIDQEHFESIIAERLGTTKDAIRFETERIAERLKEAPSAKAPQVAQQAQKKEVELDPKMIVQRKTELRQYLGVLVDLFPEEQKTPLSTAIESVLSEKLDDVKESLDATKTSGLSFTLEAYMEKTPIRQVYEETVDKLNELMSLLAREEMLTLTSTLKKAETEGDDDTVMKTLGAISAFKKKQSDGMFTGLLFGVEASRKT
ncbi:MAG: DNA primase [Patiriisocius sp.]|jgi:DNA primase